MRTEKAVAPPSKMTLALLATNAMVGSAIEVTRNCRSPARHMRSELVAGRLFRRRGGIRRKQSGPARPGVGGCEAACGKGCPASAATRRPPAALPGLGTIVRSLAAAAAITATCMGRTTYLPALPIERCLGRAGGQGPGRTQCNRSSFRFESARRESRSQRIGRRLARRS